MNPIQHILDNYPLMILDGALATELERRGCDLRDPLWSAKVLVEAPDLIKQVHADYFAAGADCATTATYQATFEGFARRGLSEAEAEALMRLAVQLAIEARDEFWADPANRVGRPKPIVAASVGSYGAFLADGSEYSGNYALSQAELMDFHRQRLRVLADSGADVLACETIPSLVEAIALARLLGEFPDHHGWISFSARDCARISHGEYLADCVAQLEPYEQVIAVGINCTAPRHVADLVSAARGMTDKPILAYPNSGEIYRAAEGGWAGAADPAGYVEEARIWYQRGARIIGGCCRTGPEEIRSLVAWARDADPAVHRQGKLMRAAPCRRQSRFVTRGSLRAIGG